MKKMQEPQVTLNYNRKTGYISGFLLEGTRFFFDEQIILESTNKESTLLGLIKENKIELKQNETDFQSKMLKEVENNLLNFNIFFGSIWSYNNEFVLIRTLTIEHGKIMNLPSICYTLWTYGDTDKYPKFQVKIKTEITTARIFSRRLNKFYRILPKFNIPKDEYVSTIKEASFLFYHTEKPDIIFSHLESRFEEVSGKLENQEIELCYTARSDILLLSKQSKQNDIRLDLKLGSNIKKFDNFTFIIEKNDWFSAFAILTTFTTRREVETPLNLKASRKAISFSRIVFDMETNREINYHKSNQIWFLKNKESKSEKRTVTSDLHIFKEQIHSLKLEECITFLQKLDLKNHPKHFETIFVLKPDPEIALTAAPFIRYSLGYPLFETEDIVERIKALKCQTKRIYLLGIELSDKQVSELEKDGYDFKDTSLTKRKTKLLRNIQNEFLNQLAVDYLITSYGFFSEKSKIPIKKPLDKIEDLKEIQAKLDFKDDVINERLNLVKKFPQKFRYLIKKIVENKKNVSEFYDYSGKLVKFIQNYKDSKEFIWRILDIGRLIKNVVYNYNVEKKEYQIFQSTNTDEPHLVLYDPNLSIGSFIALSVYATYRGSFVIPFNRNIIEKKSVRKLSINLNNEIRSRNGIVKESDISQYKENLKEYGDIINGLIDENGLDFLFKYIGKINFKDEKKLKRVVGLGYITLFINHQEIFYEGLRIENQQLGALFNIGRIPADNSVECMRIISNSFQRWLGPRPSWSTLSIISLFENLNYSEILRDIINDLFNVFNTIEAKKACVIRPTKKNFSKILMLMEKCSNLHIWIHGNTDRIEIQDGKKVIDIFSLYSLSKMNFRHPELAVLNPCRTGGISKYAGETMNVAGTLMNRGFKGILAPFWFVDVGTASDFTLNFLTNIIFGISASSIIRRGKLFNSSNFPETYVYYGDPTYTSESFYPRECAKIDKHYRKMMEKKYRSSNGKQCATVD